MFLLPVVVILNMGSFLSGELSSVDREYPLGESSLRTRVCVCRDLSVIRQWRVFVVRGVEEGALYRGAPFWDQRSQRDG